MDVRFGILGTGVVGKTIAARLAGLEHEVMVGTREPEDTMSRTEPDAEVLKLASEDDFSGKVVIDVSNPLDFSKDMPPSLSVSNTDSLGEQIQRRCPEPKVVKTLHSMNAYLMVDPAQLAGADHSVSVGGNDPEAKASVTHFLRSFGWTDIIDLRDIPTARGTEMMLPGWLRLFGALQKPVFNFKIVR
jgi:8-hydroxy-5-deazaflavin:NADPH oxidoreductase